MRPNEPADFVKFVGPWGHCALSLASDRGDGKRYEVQGRRFLNGEWEVVGWTVSANGGTIAEMARLWPRFSAVRVIDRKTKP